nr:uncharacterized protein c20g4.08 [Quercus suber]
MADLQELFARLKASDGSTPPASQQHISQQTTTQSPSIWAQPAYQEPSVSSPLFSPPLHTPNPIHSSSIISPVNPGSTVGTPVPADQSRANNLLNLLKFNGTSQNGPVASLQNASTSRPALIQPANGRDGDSTRSLSARDVISSIPRATADPLGTSLPAITDVAADKPQLSGNQDYLLNLLRKPNAPSSSQAKSSTHATNLTETNQHPQFSDASFKMSLPFMPETQRSQDILKSPVKHEIGQSTLEAPRPTKAAKFSYVNPFDQLHSSSPLNRTPNLEVQATHLKKLDLLKHDCDVADTEDGENAETRDAARNRKLPEQAITGSSALPEEMHNKSRSVSEKLEVIGDRLDKQVEQALAAAEAQQVAMSISPGIDGYNKSSSSKDKAPNEIDVDSSWESAEDSANEKKKEFQVTVYEFPMKPWVSLQINDIVDPILPLRSDNLMVIAKLKKEFDQIDRCLSTGSQSHIVYTHPATKKDGSGFRVIRQDTGDNKQVFRLSGERVFNVQFCTPPQAEADMETILGTGVNGSVFWTSLVKSKSDTFSDDDLEAQGFSMPAVAITEENTSGSPVKTRAKMSSRHPEFFGLARGKYIHLIIPEIVKDQAYRSPNFSVNSEKYLLDHGLKINTGKAGKDFCFSEDDTVIVSLDKSGRVKFWDVRDLTSHTVDLPEQKHDPIELRDPLWSFSAAASGSRPDEKPSVSSIMLLDKERAHTKGIALRYMLIGFKQNHILQLWDLGLGKAVQELRLPHEKDSDGICSIAYHPKTGIITVGHPTRNSIYFIHLSAPRYSLSNPIDQAKYIGLLARKDANLQRPDSTAIMSGMRELSFANIGQLLSLDMLKVPIDNDDKGTAQEVLFELYAMHSRGVVGISIRKPDLGWTDECKSIHGIKAVDAGVVSVSDLNVPEAPPASSVTSSTTTPATVVDTPSKKTTTKKETKKQESIKHPSKVDIIRREAVTTPLAGSNGTDQPEPVSLQVPEATVATKAASINPPLITSDSYAMADQGVKSPINDRHTLSSIVQAKDSAMSSDSITASIPPGSFGVDTNASTVLQQQFDSLYQRLDADKRVNEAAGAARQDAMLRLVSNTLTENVEQSLHRIISNSIEKDVIPSITNITSQVIDRKLSEILAAQIQTTTSSEMKSALPFALQQVLVKDPSFHQTLSDITSTQVAKKVQQQVSSLLQQALPNLVTQATQRLVTDLEKRMRQQQNDYETQRQKDNSKVEELASLVRSMSSSMQIMIEKTSALQEQLAKLQSTKSVERHQTEISEAAASATDSAANEEVKSITAMLTNGQYEEATIQWLQSNRQSQLFDDLFVRVNPQYLRTVSPLVTLSVSAAITASFDTYLDQRLEWLVNVLEFIHVRDTDIVEVAPQIMEILSQRLQAAYMTVAEQQPNSPALRKVSGLYRQVNEIRRIIA